MLPMFYLDIARTHIAELEQAARRARLARRGGKAGWPGVRGSQRLVTHFRPMLRQPFGWRGLGTRAPAGSMVVPQPDELAYLARAVDDCFTDVGQECDTGSAQASVDSSV